MFIKKHFCTTARLSQKVPGLEESPEDGNISKKRKYSLKAPGKPCSPHVRHDSEEGVGAILPAQC